MNNNYRDRRVVITGLGAVTPIGIGIEAFWNSLKEGKSGIGPVSSFDAIHLPFKGCRRSERL